eukprot:SAG31_NODE_533_length_14371_cov_6.455367_20_plen_199_part_00
MRVSEGVTPTPFRPAQSTSRGRPRCTDQVNISKHLEISQDISNISRNISKYLAVSSEHRRTPAFSVGGGKGHLPPSSTIVSPGPKYIYEVDCIYRRKAAYTNRPKTAPPGSRSRTPGPGAYDAYNLDLISNGAKERAPALSIAERLGDLASGADKVRVHRPTPPAGRLTHAPAGKGANSAQCVPAYTFGKDERFWEEY